MFALHEDLDLGADGPRLLEQGFGRVGIVLQAADALQVPGVALRVGLVGHGAMPVKHRVMDGLAVDGMRRRGAQALVLKRPAPPVEDHKMAAGMPSPDVVFVAVSLCEALDIGLGHVIDEMDLAGAQRRQAHRVLALGFADDLVQVGQVMPLGIGLPVVFKAHQRVSL